MAWQKFKVALVGHPEPIEVQTSARDWATIQLDTDGKPRAMAMTFQVAHAALLRTGADVPASYEEFLDVLDGIPEAVDGEGVADQLDPTAREP
jgi:hypothetical protein